MNNLLSDGWITEPVASVIAQYLLDIMTDEDKFYCPFVDVSFCFPHNARYIIENILNTPFLTLDQHEQIQTLLFFFPVRRDVLQNRHRQAWLMLIVLNQ